MLRLRPEQRARLVDYASTFLSEAGKRVLEDLEKAYGGECYVRGDLFETLKRSNERDVVERIKTMLKMAEMPYEIIEEEE